MTYFKRRRGALDHVQVMDHRVLQAAIDRPRWWEEQRQLVAERETVIDFSAQAVGDCNDLLKKAGIRVVPPDDRESAPRVTEQFGIRGMTLNGSYKFRFPNPVDQIDILIAHFGEPPELRATGRNKQAVTVVADDRPRQAELVRLLGCEMDRLTIQAPAGALLVQVGFPGHARGRKNLGT